MYWTNSSKMEAFTYTHIIFVSTCPFDVLMFNISKGRALYLERYLYAFLSWFVFLIRVTWTLLVISKCWLAKFLFNPYPSAFWWNMWEQSYNCQRHFNWIRVVLKLCCDFEHQCFHLELYIGSLRDCGNS